LANRPERHDGGRLADWAHATGISGEGRMMALLASYLPIEDRIRALREAR